MKTTKRKSKTVEKTPVPVAKAAPVVAPVSLAEPAAVASVAPPARVIALSSHCTIKDAAALKLDLCAMANESAEVTLDVGSIERIDTATMQLLCAFARDRAQRNQKVVWIGESQSWRDAVRLLGTGRLLGCTSVEGAQR